MEQQLASIAERMKQLKMDNSRMSQRNSTLERVLNFREGEIAELQDKHKVGCYLDLRHMTAQAFEFKQEYSCTVAYCIMIPSASRS